MILLKPSDNIFHLDEEASLSDMRKTNKLFFNNRSRLTTEKYQVFTGFLVVQITTLEPRQGESKIRYSVYMYGNFEGEEKMHLRCVSSGQECNKMSKCMALIEQIRTSKVA